MALFGTIDNLRAQARDVAALRTAWDYLERVRRPGSEEAVRLAALAEGETRRIELGGGVFALEQAYRGKTRAAGRWEAHDAHVDVQAMVEGRELMGVIARERLCVAEDLRAERDLVFFAPQEGGATLLVEVGEAAVFFPGDAHMPSLAAGEPVLLRKTVVKVPVAALGEARGA